MYNESLIAMAGPDHSKKQKPVTIDLEPNAVQEIDVVQEVDAAPVEDVVSQETMNEDREPAKSYEETAAVSPNAPKSSGGFLGKVGAGIVGGLIALIGGAGLQYAGQLPSFGSGAQIAKLESDIAQLAARPVYDGAALDVINKVQGELGAQVSALSGELSQLKNSAAPVVDGEAIKALETKLAGLEAALANSPSGGVVVDPTSNPAFKALADKVALLEAAPAQSSDSKSVAAAIAAAGLKAAIDRGGSFATELETYASVVPTSPDVEALRGLATSGVPSNQDLISGFNAAADAMISASIVPDPNMGVLQRLSESAKSLVKARRVGEIAGDEPDAVVARMEVALQRGDLAAVMSEALKLPEVSKTAGKDYLDKVTARRDADTLVTRALGAALQQAGGKS